MWWLETCAGLSSEAHPRRVPMRGSVTDSKIRTRRMAGAIDNRDLLKKALAEHAFSGDPHDAQSGCLIPNTREKPKPPLAKNAEARKTSARNGYPRIKTD